MEKLFISFQLPSSCYATVLLAEVMDTHHQQSGSEGRNEKENHQYKLRKDGGWEKKKVLDKKLFG